MKKILTVVVAALAVVSFAGAAFAAKKAEAFPEQDATVTITVTDAEGKEVKKDVVTDTTKGADTTAEYKKLQKMEAKEAGVKEEGAKAEKKPAVHKKKAPKKSAKKAKKEPVTKEAAPAPAPAETPEAK